jgi:transcriptional regulator with XRE-family HTH domain
LFVFCANYLKMRHLPIAAGLFGEQNAGVFHLGDAIRKVRKEAGLSQTKLGKLAGLNKETISKVERGKGLHHSTLEDIAQALSTTPQYLLSLVPPVKNTSGEERDAVANRTSAASADRYRAIFERIRDIHAQARHVADELFDLASGEKDSEADSPPTEHGDDSRKPA